MVGLLKRANAFRIPIVLCALIPLGYLYADHYATWVIEIKKFYTFTERDCYVFFLVILPVFLGHMLTLWAHYFRTEVVFQGALAKVTAPSDKKLQLSFWDRRLRGRPAHFWIAAFILVTLNIVWFAVPMAMETAFHVDLWGVKSGVARQIGNAAAYTVVCCVGCQIFLVLHRSMLHGLGFTYSDILPLHRCLGATAIFWATLHITTKLLGYHWGPEGRVALAFDYSDRGMMNTMGLTAYISIALLGTGTIPWVRRHFYIVFISMHRVFMSIFFVCITLHYPEPLLWYYILPSFILFLVDRFVPKMIQARVIHPMATCTFTPDADIVRMTFTSSKPMKPYYPGDYITVQVPEIGTLYHPFRIASYWAEDPCSMTLFMRVHHTSKLSWTPKLAKLCNTDDRRVRIRANVDGVFGDNRHEYLQSDVLIFFVAGTAITPFIGLIKAIAAHIAASNEPVRLQMYLICTFRTCSELHSYGSFLHQITRDPRFDRWLRVEIYVSRPDKRSTLMSPHAHDVQHDINNPSTDEVRKRAHSHGTLVAWPADDEKKSLESSHMMNYGPTEQVEESDVDAAASHRRASRSTRHATSVYTVNTVVDHNPPAQHPAEYDKNILVDDISVVPPTTSDPSSSSSPPTRAMTYEDHPLPTYPAANSTILAKQMAKQDLAITTLLVTVPLAVWYGIRAVSWEGSSHWCATNVQQSNVIVIQCMWLYSFLPGFIHLVVMASCGYLGLWVARHGLRRKGHDLEKNEHANSEKYDERLAVENGDWDESEVVYSHGRMNVKRHIDEFIAAGVGQRTTNGLCRSVSVFGGGPEGFVDMVEKHVRQAKWEVVFCRETWTL